MLKHLLYSLTAQDAIGFLCAGCLAYLTWQLYLVTQHLQAAAKVWGLP